MSNCVPRLRGDEPADIWLFSGVSPCSPPARGWTDLPVWATWRVHPFIRLMPLLADALHDQVLDRRMATSNDIRATFLNYFARNGHEVVDSSPLVPRNDPTLLFVNSGMVQFKNVFTGQERRPYSRATTSQKCVRAGGKHNDLDNVGYTARHHTFFEMLGNFSFGDYFKEQAITHAWNVVTREFGLPAEKLLVTVYQDDDDAARLWKSIAGLPEERIIRIASSDNFWRMGDTGPCGPCSEIFYDHGPSIPGGPPGSPDEDGDRFIEIWNLVFMQYEEGPPGTRVNLPRPSIDTGMGLERLAAVLQGKHDNYDTDTLRALIVASAEATGQDPDGPHKTSHRVVADHLRSTSFLMADGVLPSNEGRGYVLRRIMRRAMRHAHLMGMTEPLLYRLVPALVRQMGAAYGELVQAQSLITETLRLEETRFKAMLDRGLAMLSDEVGKLGEGQTLSGDVAFKLYDTYGFPLDLTQDALREQGRAVDVAGFDAAMTEQRRRARAAWSGSGDAAQEGVWFEIRDRVGGTEFLGYSTEKAEAEIIALVANGALTETAPAGTEVAVVLNQTPFYGESGGQVGDTGIITGPNGLRIIISDTQKKLGDVFVHLGRVESGLAQIGQPVEVVVDHQRRSAIRAHHSATHLLHEALRRRLGTHVAQKGSLNAPDRLRFDVSQPTPITRDDLAVVEAEVNALIRQNSPVNTRLMTPEQAVAEGAMALFGEKYGDEVRVVSMGAPVEEGKPAYSIELCGGTHVGRTGDIGLFRITGESAVSAGVRRIEAVTGEAALAQIAEAERRLQETASLLRVAPGDVTTRVASLLEERKKLEAQLADAQRKLATGGAADKVEEVGGVKLAARNLGDVAPKELKGLAEAIARQLESGVVALVSTAEGKASVVVGVTADLTSRFDAVTLVRAASAAVGGKGGGGRPDMAQAGGPDAAQADAALQAVRDAMAA
ncbi:Alanyl-tRNA synthetase [Granulibacter bethesdensis CGDNIH1]|nr:Alanyl-tRNA synthetase [Granulibacter bethesdensis CGDNIH1]APH52093.1 Alanyl-tRNA synthetase [Granulibacter bethesdensis]APH64784.1 Alanyl-tRNA synthetase [Granulibacter bethesdensis]